MFMPFEAKTSNPPKRTAHSAHDSRPNKSVESHGSRGAQESHGHSTGGAHGTSNAHGTGGAYSARNSSNAHDTRNGRGSTASTEHKPRRQSLNRSPDAANHSSHTSHRFDHSDHSRPNTGHKLGTAGSSAHTRNSSARNSSARETQAASERKFNARPNRRKEIVPEHVSHKPGFTSFQLRLVTSILHSVLVDKYSLDKAYAYWFAKVKLPAVEQGFMIRHINGMFRRLSLFAEISNLKRPSDFERHINRLILAYYTVEKWPWPDMDPDGMERSGLDKKVAAALEHQLYREGCPFWLEELGSRELKEQWPQERKALGEVARRFIRTNTLKCTRDELASALSNEGVVTKSVKDINTALEVTSNAALFRTAAFKNGMFEQQDAGSQEIAPFTEVEPSMRVIDACAGSGGKTLHLAALMQGKGTLIALDVEGWKLEDLKKRAKRAGAFNIDTRVIDSTKVIKRLHEHADRVLIDAPCSGLGVLRRNPDGKWSDPQPRMIELKKIQADLLERYSLMAKVGGKVVYSTCSILPSENQEQVKAFLAKHGEQFVLEEEKSILPSSGCDGFYMARFKRIA